jgi:poly(3-hydroxybutyrate) depolymerase
MPHVTRPRPVLLGLLLPFALWGLAACDNAQPAPDEDPDDVQDGVAGVSGGGGARAGAGGRGGGGGLGGGGAGGATGGGAGGGVGGGSVSAGAGGNAGTDAAPRDAAADAGAGDAEAPGASDPDGGVDAAVPKDGGAAMDGGGGTAARPVVRSAGCGRANPPTGSRSLTTGGRRATFVVNLPSSYNPNTPMPLGFAFHGFGNPACTGECVGFRSLRAITVFPKSLDRGWENNPEPLTSNLRFFDDLVALMKREYCVDESRIFVAGTSSGGQFVEHLACRHGDWLWAVSPMAAYVDRGVDVNCKGKPPALIVHGVTDRAGNYGQQTAELFARRNGCSATSPAGLAQARTDLRAAYEARRGEHRCFDWPGCTANPVRFCLFSYITYDNLTHGWPRVGGTLINEFLGRLR